jgi:hypothetical protein
MTRRFWTAAAVLLGLCLAVSILAARNMVTTVGGGAEGARALEEGLRLASEGVFAEDPPLRVFAMLPAVEGGRWRWKVEGTLLPGRSPGDPEVGQVLERFARRSLATPVRGEDADGLLLLLHVPGKADWSREFDRQGRPR